MRKMGTVSGHKLDASTETEPFWWLNISIVPNWTPQTCHVSTCENPCENPRVSQLGRSEAEHLGKRGTMAYGGFPSHGGTPGWVVCGGNAI